MTIDKAFALLNEKLCCDYNISGCSSCDISSCEEKDLCNQLAEWLEKLKYIENIILKWNADWYNDEDNGIPDNEILEAIFNACTDNGFDIQIDEDYREGYNNAIDDLMYKVCTHFSDWKYNEDDECIKQIIELASESVEEIAQELKAGGKHE